MYRGREGMLAWAAHRAAGIGIFLFLVAHIIDISLMGLGPKSFNAMLHLYTNPVARLGEVILFAAVLFHALNGIRIGIIDFSPGGVRIHRALFYAVVVLFLAAFIPAAYILLRDVIL